MGIFKKNILSILNKIAPLKNVTVRPQNKFPWFDIELFRAKMARDSSYAKAIKSKLKSDWDIYKEARNQFHKLNRCKLLAFFEKKGTKDFKNSKSFGNFTKYL